MPEELSQRTVVLVRLIDRGFPALASVVKWLVLLGMVRYGADAIGYLAGQQTTANISLLVEFFTNTGGGVVAGTGASAGALGCAYGWYERKLRQKSVDRLHGRIKHLETDIDPNRTSSGLTTRGETNPRDLGRT